MTDASAPTRPGPIAFSTVGLPTEQRLELWENHNQDALIGLRCRTLGAELLEATEINVQVDRVQLARVRGNSHVVERDAALIRRRPAESVALFFSLVGEAFFYHDDGVRTLRPGEMLMCDADRPFMRGFSHGLEELVVKIPRSVFTDLTGTAPIERPRVVGFGATGDPVARALARTVGRAVRDSDASPVDETTLLRLVAALHDERDPTADHRAAACAFIDANLAAPGLSAEMVASAVGLSTRHLSRVFSAAGSSVPRYVLHRRLDRARAILTDPRAATLQVADVARECGFSSATHFSAAFSKRFDETASQVRRRALAARSGQTE